jgi:hypothetical protein
LIEHETFDLSEHSTSTLQLHLGGADSLATALGMNADIFNPKRFMSPELLVSNAILILKKRRKTKKIPVTILNIVLATLSVCMDMTTSLDC